MNPQLKEAFMNHKSLTSVKISCVPYEKLDANLIAEISQNKKLLVKGMALERGYPTLSFIPKRDYQLKSLPPIGGFDGAPVIGCAGQDFVFVGTDKGTLTVLQNEDERLRIHRVVRAHQGRINDMHSNPEFPGDRLFIASSVRYWSTFGLKARDNHRVSNSF